MLRPSEWGDDAAMALMFAPFEPREKAQAVYDRKMAFWTTAIRRRCQSKRSATFSVQRLAGEFERYGQTPSCLSTVVDCMIRQGLAARLRDFCSDVRWDSSSNTVGNWLFRSLDVLICRPVSYVIRRPALWALGRVFTDRRSDDSLIALGSSSAEIVVIGDLVQSMAETIHARYCHPSPAPQIDNMYAYGDLLKRCRDLCTDEASFHLALVSLSRRKLATFTTAADDEKIISLIPHENNASQPTLSQLRLYKMKAVSAKLEKAMDTQLKKMQHHRTVAKEFLENGNRPMALKHMKSMKVVEGCYGAKEMALDKINALIAIVEQSESQKEILEAYNTGVEAFRQQKSDGLTADRIDSTMLNVEEMFDDTNEITQTLSSSVASPYVTTDSDDLDRELDSLLSDHTSPRRKGLPPSKSRPASTDVGSAASPVASATTPTSLATSLVTSLATPGQHQQPASTSLPSLSSPRSADVHGRTSKTPLRLNAQRRRLPASQNKVLLAMPSVPSHDPVSSEAQTEQPGSSSAMSCDVSRTSSSVMSVESVPPDADPTRQREILAS